MKDFNKIYQEIQKESAESIKEKSKLIARKVFIPIICILGIGLLLSIFMQDSIFLHVSIIIFVMVLYYKKNDWRKLYDDYDQIYKERVVRKIIKEYSEKLEYFPNRGIDSTVYTNAGFDCYDEFNSADFVTGTTRNGCKLNLAKVNIKRETTDSSGKKTLTTVFSGAFINADIENTFFQSICIRGDSILEIPNEGRVEMDSGEFEGTFNVYCKNPIIAMQILTADVMQLLSDYKAKTTFIPEITIQKDKLYMRVPISNLFEPVALNNPAGEDLIEREYQIINYTLELIEKLVKNINEAQIY